MSDDTHCPMCGGEPGDSGPVSIFTWFRCRDCGWDWLSTADPYEEEA